ncbi:MAG: hypothetical protein V5A30_00730 [Haloarculaceae archaeon]
MTDEGDRHERTVRARGSETEEPVAIQEATGGQSASLEDVPVGTVRIPASASGAEADAIATAVHAHLAASGRLPESEHDREARHWAVANRLLEFGAEPAPADGETTTDPWAVAGRLCTEW